MKPRWKRCKKLDTPYMQRLVFFTIVFWAPVAVQAQLIDSLNTAVRCEYMRPEERQMIYEINLARSNPRAYLIYIEPVLATAKSNLKLYGKGAKSYSLTYTTQTTAGKTTKTVDTTWHYANEEEVKALTSLVTDLRKMERRSVLRPDSGIYLAAQKHAADQDRHEWKLMHTGSDGSQPWNRIKQFSPAMETGNENIAGRSGLVTTPRSFVIQLLIDSGIPGYGHRYNLLNPQWTHVACVLASYYEMRWCIQNFGKEKE